MGWLDKLVGVVTGPFKNNPPVRYVETPGEAAVGRREAAAEHFDRMFATGGVRDGQVVLKDQEGFWETPEAHEVFHYKGPHGEETFRIQAVSGGNEFEFEVVDALNHTWPIGSPPTVTQYLEATGTGVPKTSVPDGYMQGGGVTLTSVPAPKPKMGLGDKLKVIVVATTLAVPAATIGFNDLLGNDNSDATESLTQEQLDIADTLSIPPSVGPAATRCIADIVAGYTVYVIKGSDGQRYAIPFNAVVTTTYRGETIYWVKAGGQLKAIPSNAISIWKAIPSNAIPSNAIPSNAIPSNALPAQAIPSNAIPSNAIPSNALPAQAAQSRMLDLSSAIQSNNSPLALPAQGKLGLPQLHMMLAPDSDCPALTPSQVPRTGEPPEFVHVAIDTGICARGCEVSIVPAPPVVDPPGGGGSVVILPDLVVPNVYGLSPDQARADIEKLGLKYFEGGPLPVLPSDTAPAGTVVYQFPAEGKDIQVGSRVTVYLGRDDTIAAIPPTDDDDGGDFGIEAPGTGSNEDPPSTPDPDEPDPPPTPDPPDLPSGDSGDKDGPVISPQPPNQTQIREVIGGGGGGGGSGQSESGGGCDMPELLYAETVTVVAGISDSGSGLLGTPTISWGFGGMSMESIGGDRWRALIGPFASSTLSTGSTVLSFSITASDSSLNKSTVGAGSMTLYDCGN